MITPKEEFARLMSSNISRRAKKGRTEAHPSADAPKTFIPVKRFLKKHQQTINKTPFDTLALGSWGMESRLNSPVMGTALVSLPFMTLTLINEFFCF
jgi:hypothetical protein